MSDDLLERATRALRDTSVPSADDIAETRARVLAGTRAARVQRVRTLRWVLPLAAAFVAGSAFAATNGQVERALEVVGAWLRGDPEPSATSEDKRPRVRTPKRDASRVAPVVEPTPAEPAAAEPAPAERDAHSSVEDAPPLTAASSDDGVATREAASSDDVAGAAARATHAPTSARSAQGRGRSAPVVLPPVAHDDAAGAEAPPSVSEPTDTSTAQASQPVREADPAPVRVENPDLAAYREAHRLHFGARNYRAALDAWNQYLARFPAGTFAQEARYNRAICLVRLGRVDEARAALAPFARGEVAGGYRKQEAQALLEALTQTE